jgi:hypothetical protein
MLSMDSDQSSERTGVQTMMRWRIYLRNCVQFIWSMDTTGLSVPRDLTTKRKQKGDRREFTGGSSGGIVLGAFVCGDGVADFGFEPGGYGIDRVGVAGDCGGFQIQEELARERPKSASAPTAGLRPMRVRRGRGRRRPARRAVRPGRPR